MKNLHSRKNSDSPACRADQLGDSLPPSYYRARYYDSQVGRFISEDPTEFSGGIDFYVYALNRPLNWVDAYGMTVNCPSFLIGWLCTPPPPPIPVVPPPSSGGGGIVYNHPPPRTVPVTGATNDALQCVARCLQCMTKNSNLQLSVTGGAETSGHKAQSFHYVNKAVDLSFFNPVTTGQVFSCGQKCGFSAGQAEPDLHHWHLQTTPGNGVPPLPAMLPAQPGSCGCGQ